MNRIYIAGPYSQPSEIISILGNIRRGLKKATELLVKGYAPFCPWADFLYSFMLQEGEKITKEQYYAYSLAYLETCEAVLLLEGWEHSPGTAMEIEVAEKLGIPVFKPEEEEAMHDYFGFGTLHKPLEAYLEEDHA